MKVNVYIDGYNFYYAIHNSSGRSLSRLKRAWCNFSLLAERLVAKAFPRSVVGAVKYFTANVGDFELRPEEAKRQDLWLSALQAGTDYKVHVIKGFYAQEDGKQRVEKQTDTKIAISMVRDALMAPRVGRPETVVSDPFAPCEGIVLISGDRDLHPAVRMVAQYGVTPVIFRPGVDITDADLEASMLPDPVVRKDGSLIRWEDYAAMKIGRGRW